MDATEKIAAAIYEDEWGFDWADVDKSIRLRFLHRARTLIRLFPQLALEGHEELAVATANRGMYPIDPQLVEHLSDGTKRRIHTRTVYTSPWQEVQP